MRLPLKVGLPSASKYFRGGVSVLHSRNNVHVLGLRLPLKLLGLRLPLKCPISGYAVAAGYADAVSGQQHSNACKQMPQTSDSDTLVKQ
jgi:hypothetical protein